MYDVRSASTLGKSGSCGFVHLTQMQCAPDGSRLWVRRSGSPVCPVQYCTSRYYCITTRPEICPPVGLVGIWGHPQCLCPGAGTHAMCGPVALFFSPTHAGGRATTPRRKPACCACLSPGLQRRCTAPSQARSARKGQRMTSARCSRAHCMVQYARRGWLAGWQAGWLAGGCWSSRRRGRSTAQ